MTAKDPLKAYLAEVRRRLEGLPKAEVEETVRELESHVRDAVGPSPSPEQVAAALALLGDPAEIARLNCAARLARQGAASRSPWRVFAIMARVAQLSLGGACALLLTIIGYALAAAFLATALVKPFEPARAGLWRVRDASDSYSYSLGVLSHPPTGAELLGWWIIPLGLVLAATLALGTFRYCRWSLRRLGGRASFA